jgi:tRNA-2-methylthio-N6-dimethylallyladenosine synthase
MPGVRRLRFVTSYPRDFTPRMVEQVGKHPNICPYLHLPVQSGADAVLRRMGRGYTRAEYLDLVRQLREARPGLSISTDLIAGFPGETEDEHRQTLELIEEVRFSTIYAFTYSPRPGTAAPRLGGDVASGLAAERLQRIFQLQEGIQRELNQGLVGEELDVIVTGWGRQPGTQTGRSACHRVVNFETGSEPVALGAISRVRVHAAYAHSLHGQRITA